MFLECLKLPDQGLNTGPVQFLNTQDAPYARQLPFVSTFIGGAVDLYGYFLKLEQIDRNDLVPIWFDTDRDVR